MSEEDRGIISELEEAGIDYIGSSSFAARVASNKHRLFKFSSFLQEQSWNLLKACFPSLNRGVNPV